MIIPHSPTQEPEEERITIKPTCLQRDGSINASPMGRHHRWETWSWLDFDQGWYFEAGFPPDLPNQKISGVLPSNSRQGFPWWWIINFERNRWRFWWWLKKRGREGHRIQVKNHLKLVLWATLRRSVWRFMGSSLDSSPRDNQELVHGMCKNETFSSPIKVDSFSGISLEIVHSWAPEDFLVVIALEWLNYGYPDVFFDSCMSRCCL